MSFEEALDVAPPKSPASTSAVARPARAAWAAIPAPMIPPPTPSRAKRRSPTPARRVRGHGLPGGRVRPPLPPRRVGDLDTDVPRGPGHVQTGVNDEPLLIAFELAAGGPIAEAAHVAGRPP